jgi:hypothetical protein
VKLKLAPKGEGEGLQSASTELLEDACYWLNQQGQLQPSGSCVEPIFSSSCCCWTESTGDLGSHEPTATMTSCAHLLPKQLSMPFSTDVRLIAVSVYHLLDWSCNWGHLSLTRLSPPEEQDQAFDILLACEQHGTRSVHKRFF